mmetsp:Transcript_941/g.2406  ORF Transcript_941/g.2406 Transcript_941/m.2406 type:complete len:504 (+) Transcript_941:100-1611(+)
MASDSSNTEDASLSASTFPTKARVVLQGLVKAPDLNGKKGVVRSGLSSAGRHTVYIEELDKSVSLKPLNLRYEPIALESLSVKELNLILKYKNKKSKNASGMDKSDLQTQVSELIHDSEGLPELLAKAKANAHPSTPDMSAHTQAAEQLSNMSPDQLRQQARMMRTMDPNVVRRMNPQLANMSDAQLKMAADRMDMMANNPSMMKMAAEQMKNMDPAQLQKMQAQVTGGGNVPSTGTATNTSSTPATRMPVPSASQAQQTANAMQNMTPEQLRQQAEMLKTMDPDTLRRTNPQLAHMSDAQIKMAATQFEMMANNPSMMKMAMDQMKNVSPEQLEAMTKGQIPSSGATGMPSPADMAQMGGDPTEMLANMDRSQLKEMLKTVKDNPEMMKQITGMTGMDEDKLKVGIDSFAEMDDAKMDAALKLMKTAQKAKNTWNQVDEKVGGQLKNILITMGIAVIGWIAWYFFFRASAGSTPSASMFSEHQQNYATGTTQDIEDDMDSEF